MIKVRFERLAAAGRLRRSVFLAEGSQPVTEEIGIDPRLYPGTATAFDTDLHEHPPEELRRIGQAIALLALGPAGLAALRERRRETSTPIRIAFEESAECSEAAALPWELMHDSEEYLALNPRTPIVRASTEAAPIGRIESGRPLKCLVFWSAPKDQTPIDIEMEQIRLGLALAPYKLRGEIDDIEILHCTRKDLDEALAADHYDLVYYTGHGTFKDGVGYLCLEKPDGGTDLLSATDLARKLALQGSPPALVFLNCCLSAAAGPGGQAPGRFLDVGRRLLRDGVPNLIATLTPVFVATSQTFMEAFLRNLLRRDGLDVTRAVAAARAAVYEAHADNPRLAQTFFQYLLLTAATLDCRHDRRSAPAEPETRRVLYASLNFPPTSPAHVRRNRVLKDLDGAYRRGARVLGLYGPGGLGKTILSTQVAERAFRHFEPELRVERALWLDLRATEGLFGALVEQLCDIVQASGDPVTALALRRDPDPQPLALVRALVESLGRHCLIVLDNCETLLDGEGRMRPGPEAELVNALACHSGWPCLLTSRERFSLGEDGREPCAIEWRRVPELLYFERTALLRAALERSRLRFELLDAELQRLMVEEVAGHPYELNLFLGEARNDMDLRVILRKVHERTGEYARLEYYVGRVPAETLPLLHLLAGRADRAPCPGDGLERPCRRTRLASSSRTIRHGARGSGRAWTGGGAGSRIQCPAGVAELPNRIGQCIGDRARVAGGDTSRPGQFFLAVSNSFAKEANERLATTADRRSHAELVGLTQRAFVLLHRALRHALEQSGIDLAALLLERFVDVTAGRVAQTRTTAYVRALRRRLDRLAETEPPPDAKDIMGAAFGVVGKAYAEQRDWPKALETYQEALAWFEKTGQHQHVGMTYHQVGRVYEEQRDWPKALETYQEALAWFEKTGQHQLVGSTLGQLGLLYEGQGDHGAAARRYQEALECFLSRGYRDPQDVVVAMRLLKQRFSAAADQEDLAPVRQRFERMLAEHPELRDLSERLDREREGED
jgi:tetratricopeptide (TPR) repeat protein